MSKRRLSQRQKARIRKIQERRRQRLATRVKQQLATADDDTPRKGHVVARYGANLAVEDAKGRVHHCLSRQNIGDIVCGDRVVWQPTSPGNGVVTALLERDTVLSRPDFTGREKPLAANVTQLGIVVAPAPAPSEYLIDQYLVAAETAGIRPLVVVNKSDLLDDDARAGLETRLAVYRRIGYPVIFVSATAQHGLDALVDRLKGETGILVGQSGVGKSSLIQALLPDRELQIGELSKATGFGRHTTSVTTSYHLPGGGRLIDSPGVRSFRLGRIDRQTLEQGFREFRPFLGRCRFSDCRHREEPGCALKQAITEGEIDPRRFENYQHMAAQLPKNHGKGRIEQ